MAFSQSLQRKLPVLMTALISAVVIATSVLAYRQIEEAHLAAAGSSLRDGTKELADIIEGTVWRVRAEARTVATDPRVVASLSGTSTSGTRAAKNALAELMERVPQVTAAAITDANGTPVASAGSVLTAEVLTAAVRRTDVSLLAAADSGVRYHLAHPVREVGGYTVGFVVVERTVLREATERLVAVVGTHVTMRLGDSTFTAWHQMSGSASAPPRELGATPVAYGTGAGAALGLVLPVESTPWLVAVEIPHAVATAGTQHFLYTTAGFAFIAVLLGALAAWLLSRDVTAPLLEMTRAAEDIARGDYARRVAVRRDDELGSLASSFNTMATQVGSAAAVLGSHARELERTNHELRESKDEYRRLVDTAHEGICVLTLDGSIAYSNHRLAEMLGHDAAELTGRCLFDFMEATHAHVARTAFAPRARGISETQELPLRRSNGSTVWVNMSSSSIFDSGGEPTGALHMLSDVTEQRAAQERVSSSERRFRALIEHASDMICIIGADGRFTYASSAQERYIGFAPAELVHQPAIGFIHPDDAAVVSAALASAHAQPGEPVHARFRHRHKDGGWRELTATATNLLHDPDVCGIVVNSHDVTEQQALARQLLQAQKMEAVGQLAGGVAHDFNNLLTVVTSYSELLLSELPPKAEAAADVRAIIDAAGRAAALTRQLLAFSRQQVLQPRVVDLNVVVVDIERMLSRLLREDIVFTLHLAPRLGHVYADPSQLEQVLVNLVVNARDAMPSGGRLTIGTSDIVIDAAAALANPDLAPGAYVLLTVSDDGMGMDAETRGRVFEPFFTTKRDGLGSGLGLATVYGIVRQSGGHVALESELGAGASFSIYLPRSATKAAKPRPRTDGPVLRHGSGAILLVEDEEAVRTAARRILERAGYTVFEAASGDEALQVATAPDASIDLLLTDMVMPGMSGRELATRLGDLRPGIRAAFMSGYTEDSLLRRGEVHRNEVFVQKPFTPQTLTESVFAALTDVAAAQPV